MTEASVQSEGAELHFDHEGSGPLLLLIAGAGGAGTRYAGISAILKDEYTVVRYDRRCNVRSTGDTRLDADIAQQARDAAAIIAALRADCAFIFGSSAGANIGLKIAEQSPETIAGLIAHEPPVLALLPDADEWFRFGDQVEAAYRTGGVGPALVMFGGSLVGFEPPTGPAARPGRPPDGNWDYFFAHEFHNFSHYAPDIQRIRSQKVPILAVAGRDSKDAYYARTVRVLSERLGCPNLLMSGHHLSYQTDPAGFARDLRSLLHQVW
jgi:pimeloyl-ACP methyl ester carboxylesterase